jgi:hypothetical protein
VNKWLEPFNVAQLLSQVQKYILNAGQTIELSSICNVSASKWYSLTFNCSAPDPNDDSNARVTTSAAVAEPKLRHPDAEMQMWLEAVIFNRTNCKHCPHAPLSSAWIRSVQFGVQVRLESR